MFGEGLRCNLRFTVKSNRSRFMGLADSGLILNEVEDSKTLLLEKVTRFPGIHRILLTKSTKDLKIRARS
jgi:hypothetical protein